MGLADPISVNQVFLVFFDFTTEWLEDGDIVLLYWLIVL